MKFGRFELVCLWEGLYNLTDSFMEEFVDDKKSISGQDPKSPGRLVVSINVVVCKDEQHVILCDTGLGTKHRNQACDIPSPTGKTRSIREQLFNMNIKAEDVTHVLLTHFHYDHAGGLTCYDKNQNLMFTFPNATVVVQKDEWHAAEQSVYEQSRTYLPENWQLFRDSSNLQLIDGNKTIIEGITLVKTNGHTPGHQIIKISSGENRVAGIFGDLIPTPWYVNKNLKMKFDTDPEKSKSERGELIEQALEEDWLVFFYHAPHVKVGKIYVKSGHEYKVKKWPDGLSGRRIGLSGY
jgi:glyoxylase-like metal-dependent hydrolase (beta-lactamase superfamily II)